MDEESPASRRSPGVNTPDRRESSTPILRFETLRVGFEVVLPRGFAELQKEAGLDPKIRQRVTEALQKSPTGELIVRGPQRRIEDVARELAEQSTAEPGTPVLRLEGLPAGFEAVLPRDSERLQTIARLDPEIRARVTQGLKESPTGELIVKGPQRHIANGRGA